MSLTVSNILHAAESTHWYTKSGTPAYMILGKNGKLRPTTLRDARLKGYVPSVTTIIGAAAKPALEKWKQEQVVLAALTLPRMPDEPEQDWLVRVMVDSREQGKRAADEGTNIHASIEGFYAGQGLGKYPDHVKGLENALALKFGVQEWIAEKSFASQMGFGGKVDLCAPGFVVDIKTKEFTAEKLPEAYDDHLMQLAAYREGLGMPNARCANVFVSRNVAGLVHVVEWEEKDLQKGTKMFVGLLDYWYAKTQL